MQRACCLDSRTVACIREAAPAQVVVVDGRAGQYALYKRMLTATTHSPRWFAQCRVAPPLWRLDLCTGLWFDTSNVAVFPHINSIALSNNDSVWPVLVCWFRVVLVWPSLRAALMAAAGAETVPM